MSTLLLFVLLSLVSNLNLMNCTNVEAWCDNYDCLTKIGNYNVDNNKLVHCPINSAYYLDVVYIPSYNNGAKLTQFKRAINFNQKCICYISKVTANPPTQDPLFEPIFSYAIVNDRFNDALFLPRNELTADNTTIDAEFFKAMETGLYLEDLPLTHPENQEDLRSNECLDEMGFALKLDPNSIRPRTCQSILMFDSREDSFVNAIYSGYQSFNRINFDDNLLYNFLTNNYKGNNPERNYGRYLTCISVYKDEKDLPKVCYQLVLPSIFHQICCCYKKDDYGFCAVHTNKLIESYSLRCLKGSFNSKKDNNIGGLSSIDPYKTCSIDFKLSIDNNIHQLEINLDGSQDELVNKLKQGSNTVMDLDKFKNDFNLDKSNLDPPLKDPVVCLPKENCPIESNDQFKLNVQCFCNTDYCNQDKYSKNIELLAKNSVPHASEIAFNAIFLPNDKHYCFYFFERNTFKLVPWIALGFNAHFVNNEDYKTLFGHKNENFANFTIELELYFSANCIATTPMDQFINGKRSVFTVLRFNLDEKLDVTIIQEQLDEAKKSDSPLHQSTTSCFSQTLKLQLGEKFNASKLEKAQNVSSSTERCYVKISKNGNDITLEFNKLTIQDNDIYDECMKATSNFPTAQCQQSSNNSSIYFICQRGGNVPSDLLDSCIEQSSTSVESAEKTDFPPLFQCDDKGPNNCYSKKHNSDRCLSFSKLEPNSKVCHECINEVKPDTNQQRCNDKVKMRQFCHDEANSDKCFFITRSDSSVPYKGCCCESPNCKTVEKQATGRKIQDFVVKQYNSPSKQTAVKRIRHMYRKRN